MKIPRFTLRKKLRASTTARRFGDAEEMSYEEMSEPNMKLSRALLIVLVLHVVAVAGIIAFNTIKSRQGAFPATKTSATPAVATTSASVAPLKTEVTTTASSSPVAATKSSTKEEAKIPKALPVSNDSDKFYTVAKGDNPVRIAKKLKVSENDLLAVNHIDDPRKLQIGQKLIVPSAKVAKAKPKKSSN